METLGCKSCGLIDVPRLEMRGNQQCAFCSGCGAFIKNIPYRPATFYIGKYKGQKIADCVDGHYLDWFLNNTRMTPFIKKAVQDRISELLEQGR